MPYVKKTNNLPRKYVKASQFYKKKNWKRLHPRAKPKFRFNNRWKKANQKNKTIVIKF